MNGIYASFVAHLENRQTKFVFRTPCPFFVLYFYAYFSLGFLFSFFKRAHILTRGSVHTCCRSTQQSPAHSCEYSGDGEDGLTREQGRENRVLEGTGLRTSSSGIKLCAFIFPHRSSPTGHQNQRPAVSVYSTGTREETKSNSFQQSEIIFPLIAQCVKAKFFLIVASVSRILLPSCFWKLKI